MIESISKVFCDTSFFYAVLDKKISLCDAVSYTVIKEHLEGVPSIAFDADFRAMGLRVL
ncbi:MAG: hypothetical protein Q7T83_05625 [Thermodesulfovibrionales bacterium]|nr:hypothetical protein [Thermodesulfovibrionales bacterium]